MIYFKAKSKATGQEVDFSKDFSNAKLFLETLPRNNFKENEYFLITADSVDELSRFMVQFKSEFFIKVSGEMFDYHKINEHISPKERLVLNGARSKAIINFAEKIKAQIKAKEFELFFAEDSFDLIFEKDNQKISYTCSYNLDIISSFVYDREKKMGVDIELARSYYVIANEVFRRQRYYYKKGKIK